MVNEHGLYDLRVFLSVAQKVQRVRDTAIHVVSIALIVFPNQFSVRLEQCFYARAIRFDDNFRQCQFVLPKKREVRKTE